MNREKQLRYIRNYLKLAIAALVFFLIAFGRAFCKAYTDPHPPHTDSGLGMAYAVFGWPLVFTILLLLLCICLLTIFKDKNTASSVGFLLTSILAVPVAVFGFFMLFATLFSIVKLVLTLIGKP